MRVTEISVRVARLGASVAAERRGNRSYRAGRDKRRVNERRRETRGTIMITVRAARAEGRKRWKLFTRDTVRARLGTNVADFRSLPPGPTPTRVGEGGPYGIGTVGGQAREVHTSRRFEDPVDAARWGRLLCNPHCCSAAPTSTLHTAKLYRASAHYGIAALNLPWR
ncbi:unnamed protein product [Calypogeia fissa]